VQSGERRLCVGTCPITGEECRANGFRQGCGCYDPGERPCRCFAGQPPFGGCGGGCKNPDEGCQGPAPFEPCETDGQPDDSKCRCNFVP
jgi:hypothetical protein